MVAVKVYRSLTNNSTQLSVIHFNSFLMILINEHCVRFSKHQMCASLVFAILRVLHARQNRGPLCLYDSLKHETRLLLQRFYTRTSCFAQFFFCNITYIFNFKVFYGIAPMMPLIYQSPVFLFEKGKPNILAFFSLGKKYS